MNPIPLYIKMVIGWMSKMEYYLKNLFAVICGSLSGLYGNWNILFQVLLIFVIVDYITGILASGIQGKLRSSIGFKGISKKIFMFLLIAVSHQTDKVLGYVHYFQHTVTFFYMANELLSIIENGVILGVPIPGVIKQAIFKLKEKGGWGQTD
ncbi:phage holin family protein [Paenibacillus larvae]